MDKENCLKIFERYISGEATADEVSQLKLFMENNDSISKWIENQILNSSDEIESSIKMRMLDNIRSQTNYSISTNIQENRQKNSKFYLRRISNIAAILLPFVIMLGAYLFLKPQNVESFEVIADMGEKASLTLPEGSKISINSGSKIIYYSDYNSKNRDIELEGEAYFDVSHNPQKPFTVQCKDIRVKVLGTSFGIKAYENEDIISVVLNSGIIQLITPEEEIDMKPNERIIYNRKTQKTSLEVVNAEDYTDWRKNRLRFEDESLEVIMNTVSRMHNIDIVFNNSAVKEQRFTGTIDNTNIETVLNAIKLTSPIDYNIKDGVVYLTITP